MDALGGGRFENIFAYQPPAGDNDASKPDTSSGAKSSAAAADAPGAEELDKLEKEVNEMHRGPYAMYPGPQYPGPHGYPPYAYPGAGMYPPPHHAEHLQRMEQEAHDSMQMQTAHASAMIRMQAQYGLELARAKNELAFAQSTASILKSWGDWFKQFFG
ncbi:MAG TPA: hypothetical protein VFP68_23840 [Burkholderiaceae bacterium]|nr:hypothetical protein [Burkholderiaceae bacterium]